jgi:hypothetical protein
MLIVPELRRRVFRKIALTTGLVFLCYLPLGVFLLQRFLASQQEGTSSLTALDFENFNTLFNQFLNDKTVSGILSLVGLFLSVRFILKKELIAGCSGMLLCSVLLSAQGEFSISEHHLLNLAFVSTLLVASLGIILAITRSNLPVQEKIIALWIILPFIGTYFISLKMPIFIDRYLSFSIPALLLSASLLLKHLELRVIKITLLFILLAAYFVKMEFTPSYNVDNRPAVQAFQDYHSRSNLSIVGPGYHDVDFTYYFNNAIFYNGANHMQDTAGIKLINEQGYTRYKEGLRRELLRNRILISHDSSNLQIDTSIVRSIAYFDGNTKLAYPDNGIIEYLTNRYGEPIERKTYMEVYSIYRFEK